MKKQGKGKDVALVLSSGGARGLAHIGAIEELERQGYRISSVAGCSMGSLVGGMFAAGRLQDFKQWMYDLDRTKMWRLTDLSLSLTHLMKGERVIEAMKDVVPDVDIEDLGIPYCAVATDWDTGREVVFRSGSLYAAIRASISMPAVFSPIRREGMILVDGGVINPLPLDRVERHEGDLLAAVNVSGPDFEGQSQQHINYITLVDRALSIAIRQNAALALQLHQPDILADIPMTDIDSFDYDKGPQIARVGELAMREALRTCQRLCSE